MEPLTIITFLAGVSLLLWGYLVGIEKTPDLIPGYCSAKVVDSAGFSRWTGYNLMATGTLGLIDGLFQYFVPATHVVMGVAYFAVIVPIMTVKTFRGMRRFRAVGYSGGQRTR